MGFSVSKKGEGVFESGREPFDCGIEVERKRIILNADCGFRIAELKTRIYWIPPYQVRGRLIKSGMTVV